jgi:hypothetical protein
LVAALQIEPVGTAPTTKADDRLRAAPELELLLACSQPAAGRDHDRRDQDLSDHDLSAMLALPLDWEIVLRLANYHRLLSALHTALSGRDDVPASIRSAIGARFQHHERRVLRFTAELARIWRQFDQHGIPVLAHKGAALGQLLYGDAAMRQFGDLDFLVHAADVARARWALQEMGYSQKILLSPRQESEYLRSGYEHVFGLNTDPNLVEVQWQIVPRFYAIDFNMEALFARSVVLDLDGLRLRTLGREDLLLVSCVHAAKHDWAQLAMPRDIATLANSNLDWNWIEAEARRLGIARILAVSLALADSLSYLSPNLAALPALQKEIRGVAKIASAVQRRTIASIDIDTESLSYFHAFMHLRERWADRLRMAWKLATTPSVGEWQAVRLSDSLFSLYRGVRLFRLLKRFFLPAPQHRESPFE